jgi:hypothetical protein
MVIEDFVTNDDFALILFEYRFHVLGEFSIKKELNSVLEVLLKSFLARDTAPLKSFIIIPEYFLSLTIIYCLILSPWLTKTSSNLMLQKTQSEVFGIILIMVGFLYYNDLLSSFAYFRCEPTSVDYSFYKTMLNG